MSTAFVVFFLCIGKSFLFEGTPWQSRPNKVETRTSVLDDYLTGLSLGICSTLLHETASGQNCHSIVSGTRPFPLRVWRGLYYNRCLNDI